MERKEGREVVEVSTVVSGGDLEIHRQSQVGTSSSVQELKSDRLRELLAIAEKWMKVTDGKTASVEGWS